VKLQLDLDLDGQAVHPGATVRGSVLVVEGGPVRLLGAALEFHEHSFSGENKVAASIWTALHREGELAEGMRFPFALVVPGDALPGYRSENGELYWEVHVSADRSGLDAHVRKRILVASSA
jgi:hypothetical protein